jgi:hypothetical protein
LQQQLVDFTKCEAAAGQLLPLATGSFRASLPVDLAPEVTAGSSSTLYSMPDQEGQVPTQKEA